MRVLLLTTVIPGRVFLSTLQIYKEHLCQESKSHFHTSRPFLLNGFQLPQRGVNAAERGPTQTVTTPLFSQIQSRNQKLHFSGKLQRSQVILLDSRGLIFFFFSFSHSLSLSLSLPVFVCAASIEARVFPGRCVYDQGGLF